LGQRGAVDHQAHFGVELGRARIEVERADEDRALIDGEGLGVQSGLRVLADLVGVRLDGRCIGV
jgi:hypothetical protein